MSKRSIIHIYASHNNTKILLTDITGSETLAKCSGGEVVKAQHRGFTEVIVKVRGTGGIKSNSPGPGSEAAIKSLTRAGIRILMIENVTPIPHDGCRKKKRFRGKKQ